MSQVGIGARCLVINSPGPWDGVEVMVFAGPTVCPFLDEHLAGGGHHLERWWAVEAADGFGRTTFGDFGQRKEGQTQCISPESKLLPLDPPTELKQLFTSELQGDRLEVGEPTVREKGHA